MVTIPTFQSVRHTFYYKNCYHINLTFFRNNGGSGRHEERGRGKEAKSFVKEEEKIVEPDFVIQFFFLGEIGGYLYHVI